jgi:hypothetical protein
VSPPVGPTGLALECGAASADEGGPRRFRAGADVGGARTTIVFTGGRDVGLQQLTTVARLEFLLQPRVTVFAGGGAVVGGTATVDGTDFHVQPGWVVTAGASFLALTETERRPFLLATAVLGYAATHTRQSDADPEVAWHEGDARLGVAVGKSFGWARPYAVARAFGGPVTWTLGGQSISGTDQHHYQLGAGAGFDLPGHFDANIEVVPLGEQGLVFGAGYRF